MQISEYELIRKSDVLCTDCVFRVNTCHTSEITACEIKIKLDDSDRRVTPCMRHDDPEHYGEVFRMVHKLTGEVVNPETIVKHYKQTLKGK